MPSEKHLKVAREMSWVGVEGRLNVIASALEAVERDTALRCAEIAQGLTLGAWPSDVIRREFGIEEKEKGA